MPCEIKQHPLGIADVLFICNMLFPEKRTEVKYTKTHVKLVFRNM